MLLSFKYREIFISIFCSKMSRNMFQFVLWLNKGESLLFSYSPSCNVINIGKWSEEGCSMCLCNIKEHLSIIAYQHIAALCCYVCYVYASNKAQGGCNLIAHLKATKYKCMVSITTPTKCIIHKCIVRPIDKPRYIRYI